MRNTILVCACMLFASTAAAQSPPSWIFMPETTKKEKLEREEARLAWIKQKKILHSMRQQDMRRARIEIRKYGYWIWRYYR